MQTKNETFRAPHSPAEQPLAEQKAPRASALTNSPGCVPAVAMSAVPALSRAELLDLFAHSRPARSLAEARRAEPRNAQTQGAETSEPATSETEAASATRSLSPVQRRQMALRRHSRDGRPAVHTDAWATPASVSWTRTRKTMRKVSRRPQSTDWALPY